MAMRRAKQWTWMVMAVELCDIVYDAVRLKLFPLPLFPVIV